MPEFYNRTDELAFFENAWQRPQAQLIALYGRRRIGKTSLLRRFSEDHPTLHYVATRLPEAQQLVEIGQQLGQLVDDPMLSERGFSSWQQLFDYLMRLGKRIGFLLDEFPYLAEANPAVPSLWQKAWDGQLADSSAFVVLCGSSVAMMEREVLAERAPLFGRRTGELRLQAITFTEINPFLPGFTFEDTVRAYAVAGGTPYYLLLLGTRKPLLKSIREFVFDFGAPLREEVDFLLRQELREPRVYFGILSAIAAGKHKLSEIVNATQLSHPTIGKYLAVLRNLGLVERIVPATELQPEKSKRGLYKIIDPFVRFWMHFVLPQRGLLETGRIDEAMQQVKKELVSFSSFEYEAICRRETARGLLDETTGSRWSRVGQWWSRTAEIDLLAFSESKDRVLIGEVKWSAKPVGTNVLDKLETRSHEINLSDRIKHTHYALFSRSGFTDQLLELQKTRNDLTLVKGLNPVGSRTP
jgi:AAA+ ATPase superfamily predicted ATPase